MLPSNTQALVDSLPERCRAANDPVAGIFWLAEVIHLTRYGDLARLREMMNTLVEMALETPDRCLILNNVQAMIDNALKMGLPALNSHFIDTLQVQILFPEDLNTGIVCKEWSVMGMLIHCRHFAFLMFANEAHNKKSSLLKNLREPQLMPVSEELLAPQSFAQPLGQWIPAYQDAECRIHDVLDLCAETRSELFNYLTAIFDLYTDESPQTQAGYFARQATRAYDLTAYDSRKVSKTYSIYYTATFIGASSCALEAIRSALLYGARIPLPAWAGPDATQSVRAFASLDGPLPELVHAITQVPVCRSKNENDDAQTAKALNRLRMDGHDIVILHQRDAHRNQQERRTALPLHGCVQQGWVKSTALLLNAGADPMAKVYTWPGTYCENGKTALDVARSVVKKNIEIEGMLLACVARTTGTDILRDMGLEGFRTLATI